MGKYYTRRKINKQVKQARQAQRTRLMLARLIFISRPGQSSTVRGRVVIGITGSESPGAREI